MINGKSPSKIYGDGNSGGNSGSRNGRGSMSDRLFINEEVDRGSVHFDDGCKGIGDVLVNMSVEEHANGTLILFIDVNNGCIDSSKEVHFSRKLLSLLRTEDFLVFFTGDSLSVKRDSRIICNESVECGIKVLGSGLVKFGDERLSPVLYIILISLGRAE